MWYTEESDIYLCHYVHKDFLDSHFNEAVIYKILSFHEIAPNLKKNLNFKVQLEFDRPTALPYKFDGSDV